MSNEAPDTQSKITIEKLQDFNNNAQVNVSGFLPEEGEVLMTADETLNPDAEKTYETMQQQEEAKDEVASLA